MDSIISISTVIFKLLYIFLISYFCLLSISEKYKPNKTKIGDSNDDILRLLKLKLENILINNNTECLNTIIDDIQPYGSRVSGTYTDNSDVDFHISYS